MQKERHQSQINQNFGTDCHTEICLIFSRLEAKLSGTIAKFRVRSLKIQHQSSFDLNNLENGPSLHFKNSLKSMHLFQRLMGGINCRSPWNYWTLKTLLFLISLLTHTSFPIACFSILACTYYLSLFLNSHCNVLISELDYF